MLLKKADSFAHILVGDLTTEQSVRDLANAVERAGKIAAVYTDPPWNLGKENGWRMECGASPSLGFSIFLDELCKTIVRCNPHSVFVEQSFDTKYRELFMSAVRACSGWRWPHLATYEVVYGSPKRINALFYFGGKELTIDPSGMDGDRMTQEALKGAGLQYGDVVVDMCIGLGTTARVCAKNNWSVIGMELVPARATRTIQWLQKRGYGL